MEQVVYDGDEYILECWMYLIKDNAQIQLISNHPYFAAHNSPDANLLLEIDGYGLFIKAGRMSINGIDYHLKLTLNHVDGYVP